MTEPRIKYEGTFEELQKDVADTKIPGQWERLAAGSWRYRCSDGAILNWWPSTDTLTFQGPHAASAHFERQLFEVCRGKQVVDTTFRGDIWTLMLCVRETAIPGTWQRRRKYRWRFRTSDGATLDWNESTGALTFKGPPLAAATLERKFFETDFELQRRS